MALRHRGIECLRRAAASLKRRWRKQTMSIARKTRAFFDYSYRLPFAVPAWDRRELGAISTCLLKGQIARGPHTKPLEDRIGAILHAEYVLSFNSGRSAIEVALRALDLSPGDEVIVPSFCCLRAVLPITRSGCVPVFRAVDDTRTSARDTVPGLCSPKTLPIRVPPLFGRPARRARVFGEHSPEM